MRPIPLLTVEEVERFSALLLGNVEVVGECWEWLGETSQGYGLLSGMPEINRRLKRYTLFTHRISWAIHRGPIPPGLCVLHQCDNPPCVRPDHLFLGTRGDNAKDRVKKSRTRFRRKWV